MTSTERMLSDMATALEAREARNANLTVQELRALRRACKHSWITDKSGLIDTCSKCGESRA